MDIPTNWSIFAMMKPFLLSIAEAYLTHEPERLIDFCFVFPNKRSATYFTDHIATLSRGMGLKIVHPATTTIVDFVESFSDKSHGDRLELIFILYGVYRDVVRRHHGENEAASIDFNRFVYWADILLNDFDDVDNSLVNPDELFKNVGDLKEISANFLTPEQVDVIRRFWNEDKVPQEVRDFWNHIAYPSDANNRQALASTGFLRLWQVMGEIYHGFHQALGNSGLHASGMAYREAVDILGRTTADELPFRRYIFVGFNNLSAAEKAIFTRLRNMADDEWGLPLADFYWDIASPAFNDEYLAGGRIVKNYAATFPSRYDCVQPLDSFPRINIGGVPSRIGQSKVVGQILSSLFPEGNDIDMGELRNTAVVLPEENMLIPLLNSLPANISPLNITMGYQLRNTAVAGLIRDIVSMQMRAYQTKVANTFFHEDVVNVLSHPLVRSYKPLACTAILLEIQNKRLFNVPESLFSDARFSGMEPVFRAISDKNNPVDVFEYLSKLLRWLSAAIGFSSANADSNDTESGADVGTAAVKGDSGKERSAMIQEAFLRRYANAVERLKTLSGRYIQEGRIFLENATVFNLVERMMQGEMLNFEGVPLKGLQIMGVLEARSLDFDTLLIPSMNERVFPRARFTASFIPVVLRNAYRLPTPDDDENVYSYFFYRMISRAKNVYLLYDARSTGLKSRQMSRYVHQLAHIFKPDGLTRRILPYKLSSPEKPEILIEKTPEIMAVIERYRSESNPLYLSASAIKQYVGCPMSFYFEKIAHYRREDDMNEWMDESVFGTIVHEVFEKLFGNLLEGRPDGVVITRSSLVKMRDDITAIDREICMSINRHYKKLGENCLEPLTGDTKLIGLIIKEQVREVLRKEQAQAPFTYLHGEWKARDRLVLQGSGNRSLTINFNCIIDRVDFFTGDGSFPRIRIIDYKTGSDETSIVSLDQTFHDFKKKAFLQVMLYAQAYARFRNCDQPIQPMIYALKRLMISPIEPIKGPAPRTGTTIEHEDMKSPASARDKWKILDYKDYVAEFNDMLIPYLEELFNPEIPFKCAENDDACKYCAFTAICGRERKV